METPYLGYMKRPAGITLLLLSILLLLTGSRCKDPDHPKPEITPCFSIVADSFRDPREPVQFVNCSDGATEYYWDFGDGKASTEANPSHTFTTTGYFDVRLAAKKDGWQEVLEKRIRVDYPRFKRLRILQMGKINPKSGQPWDPDGSGLDLWLYLTRNGEHSATLGTPLEWNISLPFEYFVPTEISIKGYWWQYDLDCFGTGSAQSVAQGTYYLDELIDSSSQMFTWDSIVFAIDMEGV